MWFVYILIGLVAIVAWVVWSSVSLCPRCGIELPKQFTAPWLHADSCRCGWRRGERP